MEEEHSQLAVSLVVEHGEWYDHKGQDRVGNEAGVPQLHGWDGKGTVGGRHIRAAGMSVGCVQWEEKHGPYGQGDAQNHHSFGEPRLQQRIWEIGGICTPMGCNWC